MREYMIEYEKDGRYYIEHFLVTSPDILASIIDAENMKKVKITVIN